MKSPHLDDSHSSTTDRPSLEPFLKAMQNFKTRFYKDQPEMMKDLIHYGQNPKALMIACCDSRVDPALLVDAAPGDLFVVRNVANLVPPYHVDSVPDGIGTAIEYAIRDLQVGHVIVMGHAHCGGIKALLNMASGEKLERDFIGNWISIAKQACLQHAATSPEDTAGKLSLEHLKDYPYLVERAAVHGSLDNLMTYPWIKAAVEESRLELHGWWFDLESGDLWVIDQPNGNFMPVY